MAVIGELGGEGTLIAGGVETPTDYQITITQDAGGMKSGTGTLIGAQLAEYIQAFEAQPAKLRLSSGDEIDIVLSRITEDRVLIQTSGPIPGY